MGLASITLHFGVLWIEVNLFLGKNFLIYLFICSALAIIFLIQYYTD